MTIQTILESAERTGTLTLDQARMINSLMSRQGLSEQEQQALELLTQAMISDRIHVTAH